jgi:hypothetical protein
MEYIYLIRLREYLTAELPIYKIGKTTQEPNTRLAGYPKGSEIYLFIRVVDCHSAEKQIIREFDSAYKKRTDIGAEYYEGRVEDMIRHIYAICTTSSNAVTTKRSFFSRLFGW